LSFNVDRRPAEDVTTVTLSPLPGLIEPQEALIRMTGSDFRIGGNRGFYSPSHDFIQVPTPQAFFGAS
jgi:antirestriction protein ArdC